MIIILHNSAIENSRNFVTLNPGFKVLDWSNPNDATEIDGYHLGGNPSISSFPSVVDTDKKILSREPENMEEAIYEINGYGNITIALQTVKDLLDKNTDSIINNKFFYNDIQFKLTQEFQLNLIALYMNKDFYSYNGDVKIKGYTVFDAILYLIPTSKNEFISFYNTGMLFIQNTLKKGWEMKDALNDLTLEELRNYVDERTL